MALKILLFFPFIVREILESHTIPLNMDAHAPLSGVKLHWYS